MRKAALTKDKDYALQNGDHEKASELDSQLLELEAKAEDAEKRRYEGGASSISAVSFINNRNRRVLGQFRFLQSFQSMDMRRIRIDSFWGIAVHNSYI